jgi:PhnB protein
MSVNTATHINLRGTARRALEFYHSVFGGDLALVTYNDVGNVQTPADAEHIIWGQVTSDNGFHVMAYDVPTGTPWSPGENAFFVSLRGETSEEIAGHWALLSNGATIVQPLQPSMWSPLYGMLKDRFGIVWILDVAPQQRY